MPVFLAVFQNLWITYSRCPRLGPRILWRVAALYRFRAMRPTPLVLPLAAMALVGCGSPEKQAEAKPLPLVRVTTETVALTEAPDNVVVSGTVRAQYTTVLASKVTGRVVSVNAREGNRVTNGQDLVKIDSRELAAQVRVADANYRAALAGVGTAQTAATMEERSSRPRITQAESGVEQAQASLVAAQARYDLAKAGPRTQEVSQSRIAVAQAESTLRLAKVELDRVTRLAEAGVVALRELDNAQNRYDLAKGQHDFAVEAEKIALEGSRAQELRMAKEGVAQAQAGVRQAQAALSEARAAALQTKVRAKQVHSAEAQAKQAEAHAVAARVGLGYARVAAPFTGWVVARHADPGALASPGSPLLTVEGGELRLVAEVPERHVGSVSAGQTVRVSIDALPGESVEARVVEVVPSASPSRHSFTVRFGLPASPGLRSGMYGQATITVGSSPKIMVPLTATWVREGLTFVTVVSADDKARLRVVTVGEKSQGRVQVLSGLKPGERIVLGQPSSVPEGSPVEAKPR